MEDDQERHFIGDLLSGDDDVISNAPDPGGIKAVTRPNRNISATAAAAPVGPPPTGTGNYWPEPPPPYSPRPQYWAEMQQPGSGGVPFCNPYAGMAGQPQHVRCMGPGGVQQAGMNMAMYTPQQNEQLKLHFASQRMGQQNNMNHPIPRNLQAGGSVMTDAERQMSGNFGHYSSDDTNLQRGFAMHGNMGGNPHLTSSGQMHPHIVANQTTYFHNTPQESMGASSMGGCQRGVFLLHSESAPPTPTVPNSLYNPNLYNMPSSDSNPYLSGNPGHMDENEKRMMEKVAATAAALEKLKSMRSGEEQLVLDGMSRGDEDTPRVKSYRDVVSSNTPPILTRERISATLGARGDARRKMSDPGSENDLELPRGGRKSSMRDCTTRYSVAENVSDSDGEKDVNDSFIAVSNLRRQDEEGKKSGNVKRLIRGDGEFQKIVRKKGRGSNAALGQAGSQEQQDGKNTKANDGSTRFEVLSKSRSGSRPRGGEGSGKKYQKSSSGGFSAQIFNFCRERLNNEANSTPKYANYPGSGRKTAYSNNDLAGDGNTRDVFNGVSEDEEEDDIQSSTRHAREEKSGQGKAGGAVRGRGKRGRRDESDRSRRKRRQEASIFFRLLQSCVLFVFSYVYKGAKWLLDLVSDIGIQLWDIGVYCTRSTYISISTGLQRAWYRTEEAMRSVFLRVRQRDWGSLKWWRWRKKNPSSWGLEENITLPATGDEAMKRLLACRSEDDAYSILGLKADCSDEEIRRYYKRQAVLVHPDKNLAYGAEEAFKILAHAWELIGEPEARRKYNQENVHRTKYMQELDELLEQLKKKMEETLSTMPCDCGNKHKRFITKRPNSAARYCKRCKDHHPARENDIWAESHWLGFLWYYYACMDGSIYDITEWAGCSKNLLKHMKPNNHLVQYRLITGKNQRQPSGGSSPPQNRQSDAEIDDFLSRILTEADRRNGRPLPGGVGGLAGAGGCVPSTAPDPFSQSQSAKYRPPTYPSGDTRPRKAGRRRKK